MDDLFSEQHVFTVSELTRDIRSILEDSFPHVWVEGEISTLRLPQSGHIYFTLKDDKAQLKCVFFKRANMRLDFTLEEGLSCILCGRISVYDTAGQYQLYVEKIEPRGKGALQLAFEQLKKKLAAEGLFDPGHKRPLPFLPQRIGIVTSATGAAIRDILHVINRRYANVHIIVRPCLVQGKTAAEDIARGIADLNAYGAVDVIIVGRGGGSMEDLWPFNEEPVARAVYNSRIPVISAVGHEIDYTICDFVADVRAPTPSAAAELVVQEKTQLLNTLDVFRKRLNEAITRQITVSRSRFSRVVGSYALRRPQLIVEQYQQRLDSLDKALKVGMAHLVREQQARFEQAAGRIVSLRAVIDQAEQKVIHVGKVLPVAMIHKLRTKEGLLRQISSRLCNLNPLAILSRGYSVTYAQATRRVLKDPGDLKKGDRIETKLHKGAIISQVEECRS